MTKTIRRLTVKQWSHAVDALRHVEADWECWEADSDPSAKALFVGIKVLRRLIDDRRPSADWQQLSDEGRTDEE